MLVVKLLLIYCLNDLVFVSDENKVITFQRLGDFSFALSEMDFNGFCHSIAFNLIQTLSQELVL